MLESAEIVYDEEKKSQVVTSPVAGYERSSCSVRIDRDRKTILVHMLWVLLFVGKARKTSFGVGSLPIDAVATRSRRKSSCYPPPLLSSMSHQTDSISVCGSARRQSIGKDEDKEEPFFIHRSEWSKWKADKRNSVQLQGSVLSSVPGPLFSCGSFFERQTLFSAILWLCTLVQHFFFHLILVGTGSRTRGVGKSGALEWIAQVGGEASRPTPSLY